jgi:hypothetical protein
VPARRRHEGSQPGVGAGGAVPGIGRVQAGYAAYNDLLHSTEEQGTTLARGARWAEALDDNASLLTAATPLWNYVVGIGLSLLVGDGECKSAMRLTRPPTRPSRARRPYAGVHDNNYA